MSKGIKRRITGLLAAVLEVARSIPQLAFAVPVLEQALGVFGGVAVGHAAVSGTLSKAQLSGIASALSILVGVAHFVPTLWPALPVLAKLSAFFGALGAGDLLRGNNESASNGDSAS